MTLKDLTENEELDTEFVSFEEEHVDEEVDELWEFAYLFARFSASKSVPAKQRRVYGRLSDLCDRAFLAKGDQREALIGTVHTALAQLEKTLRGQLRAHRRH